MSSAGRLPSVAVITPNYNGAEHLAAFLDSVAVLDYGSERIETIVVDNGSSDGSLTLLAERYPWVRVLPQTKNLGFAEAINIGARATSADCLALANNDMRLDPSWLRELVRLYAPEHGYACVGGLILDWEGERVDFVEGFVNFHGAAFQDRFGQPIANVDVRDGRDLAFACGGSMLIGRELFLELGGFDPAFFAYFEDADLGWRLWLSGHAVRLAARARSFHRHHGTASAAPLHQRRLLLERNALVMLLKNLEDEHVARLLGAALLLLVQRAVLDSSSDRRAFDFGADTRLTEEAVPRTALAPLHAVADVVGDLEGILERRREVQRHRRRSDAEIFRGFGRPFMLSRATEPYDEIVVGVVQAFQLEQLFAERRATRLLVVGADNSGRLREIARAAAGFVPVVFASPEATTKLPGVEVVQLREPAALHELLAEADVVLVEGCSPGAAEIATEGRGLLVVDLDGDAPLPEVTSAADLLTCGSESERERWLRELGRPVEVVGPDSMEPLRELVEEPWRWRTADRPAGATEDVQALLARWRRAYGVGRPAAWHVARAVWRALPPSARQRLRRLRR